MCPLLSTSSLAHQMSQLGWCKHSTALISPDKKLTTCEKGLHLMRLLAAHCDFSSYSVRLKQLSQELQQLMEEPEMRGLVSVVEDIISTNIGSTPKEEL